MPTDAIEGALRQAAEAMNDFVESFDFYEIDDEGGSDVAVNSKGEPVEDPELEELLKERGNGICAQDPHSKEWIKADEIDGSYHAGKINDTTMNFVSTAMGVEQTDKAAHKRVESGLQ